MRSIPTISSWRLTWLSKLKKDWLHFSILYAVRNNLVVVYFLWGCILAYNVSIFSSFNSVLISIVVHCVHFYFLLYFVLMIWNPPYPFTWQPTHSLEISSASFFLCPDFQSSRIYTASEFFLFPMVSQSCFVRKLNFCDNGQLVGMPTSPADDVRSRQNC